MTILAPAQENMMCNQMILKLEEDYPRKIDGYLPPPPPESIGTLVLHDLSKIPPTSEDFLNILNKLLNEQWHKFMSDVKSYIKSAELIRNFEENMKNGDLNCTMVKQVTRATYETLKPLFVNHTSEFMHACISHIGPQFPPIARTIFTTESTKELVHYLVQQLFSGIGSAAFDDKEFSWLEWLIECALFILKWILQLLLIWTVNRFCSVNSQIQINQFLQSIVPRFVNWIVNKIKGLLRPQK